MGYQRQSGENLGDGNFIKIPSLYHLIITQIDDPVTKKGGEIIPGKAFRVHFEALAANVAAQEKKTCNVTYSEPLQSHADGGEYAGRLIDRFAVAVGLIGPKDKRTDYVIDGSLVGRQLIANLEPGYDRDNKPTGFMEIAGRGLEIYHVDDPAIAAATKHVDSLKLIPAALRRTNANAKPATPAPVGAPVGAGAGVAATNGINTANL